MDRIRKMREKNKGKNLIEVFVSNKIMEYAKKLENDIKKRESLKETDFTHSFFYIFRMYNIQFL